MIYKLRCFVPSLNLFKGIFQFYCISELLIILFFIWYVIEWVIRLAIYWNFDEAYRNISFEQEAYDHEAEHYYLSVRKHFAWMRYIFKKSYEKN